jgi:hypothetical protein
MLIVFRPSLVSDLTGRLKAFMNNVVAKSTARPFAKNLLIVSPKPTGDIFIISKAIIKDNAIPVKAVHFIFGWYERINLDRRQPSAK